NVDLAGGAPLAGGTPLPFR
ncbi:hypothetical protein A2U01_0079864, partial [Trifolium medium]|nr:hypothetical protein [Trifolium medium]